MKFKLFLLSLFSLFLTACPYESEQSLVKMDEGDKLDRSLLGTWTAFYEDGTSDEISVAKSDRKVFIITHKKLDKHGRMKASHGKFRIYGKEMGDAMILNAEKKSGGHFFAKYEFVDKEAFNLYLLKKEYVEENFTPPEQDKSKKEAEKKENPFRLFLREHTENPEAWNEAAQFINNESEAYRMHKLNRGF